MVYGFKIAGAAAERGDTLDRVAELAERVVANTRTMGVGLSPTILPAAGQPTFELDDGEMEVGIGIHGEPGIHRGPLETADEIAERLTTAVLDDLDVAPGSTVSVLVNGLGATPLEELYVLYSRVSQIVAAREIHIHSPFVGNLVTSLEMAGASVSILLLDDELTELLDAPAASPFFQRGGQVQLDVAVDPTVEANLDEVRSDDRPEAVPTPLAQTLLAVLDRLPAHADELRDLDAALGDGDLGVTISAGAAAASAAIRRDPSLDETELIRRAGAAFASANPSTFAALVGGAVVASSSTVGPDVLTREGGQRFARAIAERIATRGGAQPGDKTVLDVLLVEENTLDTTIDSVRATISASSAWPSARGRAAWLRERSIGLQDPGMTAYLDFLLELRSVVEPEKG
jgi:dihydroxyacetone kinase